MGIDSMKEQLIDLQKEGVEKIISLKEKSPNFRSFLPDDIETAFFSIVRKICMFIASVSIIVVIIFLLSSLSDFMSSADEDILEPDISYIEYKEELQNRYDKSYTTKENASSLLTQQKERKLIADSKSLKFEKKFDKYYNEIEKNLNDYAKIVGDDPVSNYNIREWILKKTIKAGNLDSLDELNDFVEHLRDDADKLKILGGDDQRRPKWIKSLEWFFDERDKHLENEHERIQQEHFEAMTDKAEALTQLMVAGSAFITFMFFVIILVLMRIESNTRIQPKNLS